MRNVAQRLLRIQFIPLLVVGLMLLLGTASSAQTISGQLSPNDDESSNLIPLGFTFRFYNTDYTGIYINNNGNITFNGPLSTYTPFAFPSNGGRPMIAPFFADVDTRNGKGRVYYTGNGEALKITWENVGYYNATDAENANLRNTFSLTLQKNNGIIFQYASMTWTTGDASGGSGGYGGSAATLGVDRSNGSDAVPFRRYDSSGVSELNGTTWYFQTDKSDLPVPLFKQSMPPWGGTNTLNSGTEIMRNTGCFVTSSAMVLKNLGHNTDPGKLNVFLRDYMSGGVLNFANMPQDSLFFGQEDEVPGPKLRFRSSGFVVVYAPGPLPTGGDVNLRAQIATQIGVAIRTYGPIILRVPSRNWGVHGYGTSHTHAIVARGVTSDNDVLINDPGWNGSPGTLGAYVTFVNDYVRDQKNQPTWQLTNADGTIGGQDFSWLANRNFTFTDVLTPFKKQIIEGQVNSPVEIVITDSLGRRLGKNPRTGVEYREIPDSVYFHELAPAPADDQAALPPAEHTPLLFEIGDYIPGTYRVEVFGTGVGPWSVSFGVSDPVKGYNPQQYRLSGTARPSTYQSFRVSVGSAGPIVLERTAGRVTGSGRVDLTALPGPFRGARWGAFNVSLRGDPLGRVSGLVTLVVNGTADGSFRSTSLRSLLFDYTERGQRATVNGTMWSQRFGTTDFRLELEDNTRTGAPRDRFTLTLASPGGGAILGGYLLDATPAGSPAAAGLTVQPATGSQNSTQRKK